MQRRPLLAAALALSLGAGLAAQSPHCHTCKSEGTVPCKDRRHDPRRYCGIELEHRCDAIWSARCCRGLERQLCSRCENEIAQIEMENALRARKQWVKRVRGVGKKMGVRMSHVQTRNFLLHYSIRRFKYGLKHYDMTRGAHFFADVCELTAKRFKEVTGTLSGARHTMWIVPSADQNMAATLHFMGVGHRMAFKVYSDACKVACWPRPPELTPPEQFRSHVIHNAAHCLVQSGHGFIMEFSPWFDAGMAHWLEYDISERITTFCFNEVNVKDRWKNGRWMGPIHGEVRRGDELQFAAVIPKVKDGMHHRDHAYCWSFVDFLIKTQPEEFKTLYRELKKTNDTKVALDRALGWSTTTFQEKWRRFVLVEYANK